MMRWFRLVGLRMKTLAVCELEYRYKPLVAGGPDTNLFNMTTRAAFEAGGNEYDAAVKFLSAKWVLLEALDVNTLEQVKRLSQTSIRLLPKARLPSTVEADVMNAIGPRNA